LAGEFLPLVGKIAERYPGLRLIVDHFGVARGNKDDAAFVTMLQVVALAKPHFTEHQPWLPEDDKALIMGQAITDWLGWKPTHGS
jgi:hypothetical protein